VRRLEVSSSLLEKILGRLRQLLGLLQVLLLLLLLFL
jgi:hypothetical protein